MIGTGERNKTLRVLGGGKNLARILDPDHFVGRGMENQQRLAQRGDTLGEFLPGDIVQEFAADAERPAGECDRNLATRVDLRPLLLEQPDDVGGVAGRCDRHHRPGLRNGRGRCQDRGAAKTVADQDRGRASCRSQGVGGGHEVGDVGGEIRVGELAFAAAKPREVEAQYPDTRRGQPFGDASGCLNVLPASEAMGKQRIGAGFPRRPVDQPGEPLALGIGEFEAFARHFSLLFRPHEIRPIPGRRPVLTNPR